MASCVPTTNGGKNSTRRRPIKLIVEYEQIAPEKLPLDPSLTGEGWTFEPEEHDEITFPNAIKATDAEGRSYTYLAVGPDWREVRITNIERQDPHQDKSAT
jgi:hypothetical protein